MRNGIIFTSHGPVLECKHSSRVDVYLCLAHVSPSENNCTDDQVPRLGNGFSNLDFPPL